MFLCVSRFLRAGARCFASVQWIIRDIKATGSCYCVCANQKLCKLYKQTRNWTMKFREFVQTSLTLWPYSSNIVFSYDICFDLC